MNPFFCNKNYKIEASEVSFTINHYQIEKILGQGSFGNVFKAQSLKNQIL